jgi:hypothetical protein
MNNIQQQNLQTNQSKEQLLLHNNYQQQINNNNFLKDTNDHEKKSSTNISEFSNNTEHPKLILNNVENIKNNNNNSINDTLTNSNLTNNGSNNVYLITPYQDSNLNSTVQMAVKQPIQKQFQFINANEMQQQNQQQHLSNLKFIAPNTNTQNVTNRVIFQQQQQQQQQQNLQQNQSNTQTAFIVQPQQIQSLSNASQMYVNINNRIVPIQTLNIKQPSTNNTPITVSTTSNGNDNLYEQQNTNMQRLQVIGNNTNTYTNVLQQNQIKLAINQPIQPKQIQQNYLNNDSSNLQSLNNNNNVNICENSDNNISTNQPQYFILSNNNNNNNNTNTNNNSNITSISGNNSIQSNTVLSQQQQSINNTNNSTIASTLSVEITEKMRELEIIQNQLRNFQVKLQSNESINNKMTTTLTQQQIQSVLTPIEHAQLQKLLLQRKTVQNEIQGLQQKLFLAPSTEKLNISNTTTITTNSNLTPTQTTTNNNTPLTKLQLYQQLIVKLNNFKNSKTATIINNNNNTKDSTQQQKYTQELRLTREEFESYKKLIDLQAQLEKELNLTREQIQLIHQKLIQNDSTTNLLLNSNIQNETSEPSNKNSPTISSVKLSECSLSDKYKILDLIKKQVNTLQTTLNLVTSEITTPQQQQQHEQMKEKYNILIKKQVELQNLIQIQENEENNKNANNINENTNDINQFQQINILKIDPQSKQINFNTNNNNIGVTNSIPSSTIHMVNSLPLNSSPNVNKIQNFNSKQAPVKIRNVIATVSSPQSSPANSNGPTTIGQITTIRQNNPQTPLRALVLNNNSNSLQSSNIDSSISNCINNTVNEINANVLPLSSVINLQKQHFPNLVFKCLNFEELAQHGLITKMTDESTIEMLKELDLKASQLINQEQIQTFTKNQVKLARKYLEQQIALKQAKRRKFQEQLSHDHKHVLEKYNSKTVFENKLDAIKCLTPYHILQKTLYEPTDEENLKFDQCFDEVSEKLLKTADAMKKRFHLFQLRSMQKQTISSEETLMLKLFVDDLKQNIELEKKSIINNSNNQLQSLSNNIKSSVITTNTTSNNVSNDSPHSTSTIRQILCINNDNSNNINNDFNLINPLKRHLTIESSSEIKNFKQQAIYNSNDIKTQLNISSIISLKNEPTISSSSSNSELVDTDRAKLNIDCLNQIDEEKNNHLNHFNHHDETINFLTTNNEEEDLEEEEDEEEDISGLNDLMLNEDDLV